MCPPSSSPTLSARSRLMRVPWRQRPTVVMRSVSTAASTANQVLPLSWPCARHLSSHGRPLVPATARRAVAAAGPGLAPDRRRRARADRGADRVGQDARGVPARARRAAAEGLCAARHAAGRLRVAAARARERRAEEPAAAAGRAARARAVAAGGARARAHRRHAHRRPCGDDEEAAAHPRDDAGVAVHPADDGARPRAR